VTGATYGLVYGIKGSKKGKGVPDKSLSLWGIALACVSQGRIQEGLGHGQNQLTLVGKGVS